MTQTSGETHRERGDRRSRKSGREIEKQKEIRERDSEGLGKWVFQLKYQTQYFQQILQVLKAI